LKNKSINLKGFASCSSDKSVGLEFAFWEDPLGKSDKKPVLLEIEWPAHITQQHFKLDSEEFSPFFKHEKEVLLLDGCKMVVVDVISGMKTIWIIGRTYTLIKLRKSS
jgi:hypothetical protein